MKKKGLNQVVAAKLFGVSQACITQILHGTRNIAVKTIDGRPRLVETRLVGKLKKPK
jgi:predicted transcriptional regulator